MWKHPEIYLLSFNGDASLVYFYPKGSWNVSFIVSDTGRSSRSKNVYSVDGNDEAYTYQTYAGKAIPNTASYFSFVGMFHERATSRNDCLSIFFSLL